MKKSFLLLVGLILVSLSLTALEPTRISIVTTPDESTGQTLKVDILQSNGSAFDPVKTIYINDDGSNASASSTDATTDASGRISFVLSHSTWTGIVLDATSKNYLVRVTYGSTVLSIERVEVVIAKQSLFGATISPDAIAQTENFTFKQIGILESGSNPTDQTILQGGEQTSNITYTLPKTAPTAGQVLSVASSPAPTATSATLEWVTPSIGGLSVGMDYQGGIIAYLLQFGDPGYDRYVTHGIIAAPSDQSTGIVWHTTDDGTTGAQGRDLGTGNANTIAITALYGTENNAAKLCADLVLGGYNDWYLPSREELIKLYLNQVAVGGFSAQNYYWSSSEVNTSSAEGIRFHNGSVVEGDPKSTSYFVRAVRAF